MRQGVLALVLLLAAAACGGDAADTTEPSQFPTGSVRSWFDALEAGNTEDALELTYDTSMLVILSAENALDPGQVGSLLRRGATEESSAEYIGSFGSALRDRYGSSLSAVSVDGFTGIGEHYAAVEVTGEGGATIMLRQTAEGLWQVDLVGTVGPALIGQLRSLLESAGDGEDGDTIRDAFRDDVVPSLEAAADHDPQNLTLAAEIRAMKAELGI